MSENKEITEVLDESNEEKTCNGDCEAVKEDSEKPIEPDTSEDSE